MNVVHVNKKSLGITLIVFIVTVFSVKYLLQSQNGKT